MIPKVQIFLNYLIIKIKIDTWIYMVYIVKFVIFLTLLLIVFTMWQAFIGWIGVKQCLTIQQRIPKRIRGLFPRAAFDSPGNQFPPEKLFQISLLCTFFSCFFNKVDVICVMCNHYSHSLCKSFKRSETKLKSNSKEDGFIRE